MSPLPVSVIVVSRGRPESLTLCLTGLSRQFHDTYEVIVVADPAGMAAVARLPFADEIKTVPFDEANIAAARNRGLAVAAGEVVAFIDDDAPLRELISGGRMVTQYSLAAQQMIDLEIQAVFFTRSVPGALLNRLTDAEIKLDGQLPVSVTATHFVQYDKIHFADGAAAGMELQIAFEQLVTRTQLQCIGP